MRANRRSAMAAIVACTFASCRSGPPPLREERILPASATEESKMLAHPDEVASYTIEARLDPAEHAVHAEGTIRFKNGSRAVLRDLFVHLYMNGFKNSKSTFLSEVVPGFRGSGSISRFGGIEVKKFVDSSTATNLLETADRHPNGGEDESEVRLPLTTPMAVGETREFRVAWDVTLPSIIERTGFYQDFHFVGQWFPKLARLEEDGTWAHFPFHHLAEFYADFGTYDVTLDVPESFVVGATGKRTELGVVAGRRRERYVQGDIHDFAWTAWSAFVERAEKVGDVDVRILYPRGYEGVAERELEVARFALPHFRARYGPYPYETLTIVHPPAAAGEAGGMEYPTLITTGGSWAYPRFARAPEIVTIHEFGHQYFYGLVATNEERWPFLDEGLNSFAEAEAMTSWYGDSGVGEIGPLRVGLFSIHSATGSRYATEQRVSSAAPEFVSGNAYAGLVYSRSASVHGTLLRIYGDAYLDALGVYARRFRFRHPGPEDYFATIESALGKDAGTFLRTALTEKGWVDYALTTVQMSRVVDARGTFGEGASRATKDGAPIEPARFSGFAQIVRRGTLELPVEVEIVHRDGSKKRATWDGHGDSYRVPIEGTSGVSTVVLDPDHKLLVDADPANHAVSFVEGATDRSFVASSLVAQWLTGGLLR